MSFFFGGGLGWMKLLMMLGLLTLNCSYRAGMIDMVRKGEIEEGSNVLYAHLGGQLALNAYSSLF